MNTPELPLVFVTWNDANVGGDDIVTPENIDAYHKPTVVRTLGWLFKEDEIGVTIVNEYYDNTYRGRTFIYRPMIISIDRYRLAKTRTPKVKESKHEPIHETNRD